MRLGVFGPRGGREGEKERAWTGSKHKWHLWCCLLRSRVPKARMQCSHTLDQRLYRVSCLILWPRACSDLSK